MHATVQPVLSERVIVYVDGFNLYHGLRESGWKRLYWLDIARLAANLMRSQHTLVGVKYFTSRINGPTEKAKRQTTYVDALKAHGGLAMFFGHYRTDKEYCTRCCKSRLIHGEKKTDVNIATHLILDAFSNSFDTAVLVSGDGDLLFPVEEIPRRLPGKQIWVAFPPNRPNRELEKAAGGKIRIRKKCLERSLLPEAVRTKDGLELRRPEEWREDRQFPVCS